GALAKSRIEHDRAAVARGDALRGFVGPAQVARDDRVAGLPRQALADRLGLRDALFRELAVALDLDDRRHVPVGLAVAHHDEAGHCGSSPQSFFASSPRRSSTAESSWKPRRSACALRTDARTSSVWAARYATMQ